MSRSTCHNQRYGLANSRLKDYYDIWFLLEKEQLETMMVAQAIRATFDRRKTRLPSTSPEGLSDDYVDHWNTQWKCKFEEELGAPPFAEVMGRIRDFLLPILVAQEVK